MPLLGHSVVDSTMNVQHPVRYLTGNSEEGRGVTDEMCGVRGRNG